MAEEDARREYVYTAVSIGGLLDWGCCTPSSCVCEIYIYILLFNSYFTPSSLAVCVCVCVRACVCMYVCIIPAVLLFYLYYMIYIIYIYNMLILIIDIVLI